MATTEEATDEIGESELLVAEKGGGAGGNPLERIERLLTCPICLDRYKQPKLLSCQHTFCLSCLESYVESSGVARLRIRCPECRAETVMDGDGVQSLPTNLTLMSFLEIHLEASDVNAAELQAYVQRFNMERCRICEEKAELELCAHCERKCCAECRTAHVDMLKRDLIRLLGQVRRLSSRVMDASKGLSRGLEQLGANGEQTKSEIRDYFNRYQKELRRREEHFIDQVEVFVQTEDRLMRTLRDALDVEWNNLQDACLWVDAALGGQHQVRDDELARFKTVFAQGLEYLRSFQPDSEEMFAKKVRFSPGDDAAKLPTAIANFGELNVSLPQFANRYLPLEQQYLPRPFRLGLESEHFMRPPGRDQKHQQRYSAGERYGISSNISRGGEELVVEPKESAGAQRWRRRRELEEEAWGRLRAESSGSAWASGRATPSGALSPLTVPLLSGGSVSPAPISPAMSAASAFTPQPMAPSMSPKPTMVKKAEGAKNEERPAEGSEARKEGGSEQKAKKEEKITEKEETVKKSEEKIKGKEETAEKKTVPTTKERVPNKGEVGTIVTKAPVATARTGPSTSTAPSEDPSHASAAGPSKKEPQAKKAPAPTAQVPTFTTAPATMQTQNGANSKNGGNSKNGQAGGSQAQQQQQQQHRGRVLMVNGGGSSSSKATTPRRTLTNPSSNSQQNNSKNDRKPPMPHRQFSMGTDNIIMRKKQIERDNGRSAEEESQNGKEEPIGRRKGSEAKEEEEEEEEDEDEVEERRRRGSRQMQIQSQSKRFRIHCRSSSHGRRRNSGKLDIGQPIPVVSSGTGPSIDPFPLSAFFPAKSTGEWSSSAASDDHAAPLQSGLLTRSRTNPDLFTELRFASSMSRSSIREALEARPRPKTRKEFREQPPEGMGMLPQREDNSAEQRRMISNRRRAEAEEEAEEDGSRGGVNYERMRARPRLVLGGRGTAPDQMNWPRGVCAFPPCPQGDDLFAVADSSNHRVQIFSSADGTLIRTFGTFGNGDAEFDGCCSVCVNGARRELLVADRYNHRVQVFDLQGRFRRKFGCRGNGQGQFQHCWGIAVDEQLGLIYVTDKDNHRVQMFDAEGAFITKFGSMGDGARQFNHPLYLAFHARQRCLYVSDSANNRISVFSPEGTPLRQFGGNNGTQLKLPRGIFVDHQGRVVVADSGNNRVQVLSPSGHYLRVFGSWGAAPGQFKGVEGICVLSNGHLVVADRENNRVQLFA